MKTRNLLFLLLLPLTFLNFQTQDTATQIIKRADDKFRGTTAEADMTMKIVRPDYTRSISMKTWTKGTDYAMILITSPARDKGTAFLKRKNEIWNWLPSISRMIKLPPSMMMQSWMGSDFTNDDLVHEASIVEDYTHSIIGDSTVEGYDCYKIKMVPHPDAAVVWGKVITFVSKKKEIFLRTEYYDEEGELVNVMNYSDVKMMGGREIPTYLEMYPADKKGHKTILIYNNIDFGAQIDDSFFSQQQMKRLR